MPQKADHENDSLLSDTEEIAKWNKTGMNEMRMNEIWKWQWMKKTSLGLVPQNQSEWQKTVKEEKK